MARTSTKSSKVAIKFAKNIEQEAIMVAELNASILDAKVWTFAERETLMVKQIPKWLGDDDVIPELIENNALSSEGIEIVRFLNSDKYPNKRVIIKVDRPNFERIKMNDKLRIAYGCAEYTILHDDPKKISCFHCKKAGHRAWRREKKTVNVDGVEKEVLERVLICPNA